MQDREVLASGGTMGGAADIAQGGTAGGRRAVVAGSVIDWDQNVLGGLD